MKAKIVFNTGAYLFAHGKRPSGKGWWVFRATLFCDGRETLRCQSNDGLLHYGGTEVTLTEAKRRLKADLKTLVPNGQYFEFEVMP